MKKIKLFKILTLVLISTIGLFLFSSCNLFTPATTQINAPILALSRTDKKIYWASVENATSYEVYINGEKKSSVVAQNDTEEFSFAEYVVESGSYALNVKSITTLEGFGNSEFSQKITYVTNSLKQLSSNSVISSSLAPNNVSINAEGLVSWGEVNNVQKYVVMVFTNQLGLKTYDVTTIDESTNKIVTSFNLNSIKQNNDIMAVNVGAKILEDDNIYVKTNKNVYYNPQSVGEYTSSIYIFDGYIFDYYIENTEELNNMVYYQFIERRGSYNIKISNDFALEINSESYADYITDQYYNNSFKSVDYYTNGYNRLSVNEKIQEAIDCAIVNYFTETCYFKTKKWNDSYCGAIAGKTYEYEISIDYFGITECDTNINTNSNVYSNKVQTQFDKHLAYYEYYKSDTPKRSESYNNFVSDSYFLSQSATTSEELYHLVENKITPLCVADSRAETIYNLAKNVLREIINDGMTDFEKVVSIFDWICINTTYDYSVETYVYDVASQSNILKTEYAGIYSPKVCSYYLEGVFIKQAAVCDGFSKAFSLMCNMEGIECIRVVGKANVQSGLHAWNKVLLNNEWYLVDITWTEIDVTNPSTLTPQGIIPGTNLQILAHKYFLVSDLFDVGSHISAVNRTKFSQYTTGLYNYNYYGTLTYSYKNSENATKSAPVLIDSDEDITNILFFALDTNIPNLELAINYTYAESLCEIYETPDVHNALLKKFRSLKYRTQYLHTSTDGNVFLYDNQNLCYLMNIEFTHLIDNSNLDVVDSVNELSDLVEYFESLKTTNPDVINYTFDIYLDIDFLEDITPRGVKTIQQHIDDFITFYNLQEKIKITSVSNDNDYYKCLFEFVIPETI